MKQNRIKLTARILVLLAFFRLLVIHASAAEKPYMVEKISVEGGYFLNDFQPDVHYYDVIMSSFTYNLSISVELTDSRFEYEISGDDEITAPRFGKHCHRIRLRQARQIRNRRISPEHIRRKRCDKFHTVDGAFLSRRGKRYFFASVQPLQNYVLCDFGKRHQKL